MTTWSIIGLFVLGILLAMPAAIIISSACGAILSRRRLHCPSCDQRALRCVQWIRATIVVNGKRAPDSWSYYLCEFCGAHYKKHLGHQLEIPSEAEWAQYVQTKGENLSAEEN